MSWANMRLHPTERDLFNAAVHMFPTNNLVSLHNMHMLKSLNYIILHDVLLSIQGIEKLVVLMMIN